LTASRGAWKIDLVPDQLTLDVVDRPADGVVRSMRYLTSLRQSAVPGLRSLIQLGTARFITRPYPAGTPRRIAVLAAWDDGEHVEERWASVLGDLTAGAREHWHLRGEVVRAAYTEPWRGWIPDADGAQPMGDDEPALMLISGNLKARYVARFFRDGAKAVAHAFDQPGYLGGLAVNSSPLNTTSCSAWRSYADAKAYAFRPGAHSTAMKRDRANGHHRTEWFTRVRPLEERGTLAGAAPFAGLLAATAAAGPAASSAG
jgi:hypothetical protein